MSDLKDYDFIVEFTLFTNMYGNAKVQIINIRRV